MAGVGRWDPSEEIVNSGDGLERMQELAATDENRFTVEAENETNGGGEERSYHLPRTWNQQQLNRAEMEVLRCLQCPGFRSSAPAAQSLGRDPDKNTTKKACKHRPTFGPGAETLAGFGLSFNASNALTVISRRHLELAPISLCATRPDQRCCFTGKSMTL